MLVAVQVATPMALSGRYSYHRFYRLMRWLYASLGSTHMPGTSPCSAVVGRINDGARGNIDAPAAELSPGGERRMAWYRVVE